MRKAIFLFLVLLFSGCVAQSKKLCSEYGFLPGSPEFSVCVMNETHRSQDAWSDYADQMKEDSIRREEADRQSYRDMMNSIKPRMRCTTKPDFRDGSITECY